MDHVDTVVIGAGVIGLAVTRALALSRHEVLLLEREPVIGSITSSRNSGVIHAGIYYQPGSFKARFCVDGRHRLYAYAVERGIPHKQCGKLIVATSDDQIGKLNDWYGTALENGVEDLKIISGADAQHLEPNLSCKAALHVSVTGIIDVHSYMLSLLGDGENNGATLALAAPVESAEVLKDGFRLQIGGYQPLQLHCKNLVNAAGLGAQKFARAIEGLDPSTVPPLVLAKGNYFGLKGSAAPFERLIYPLPVLGSSGLHVSRDMGGQTRFGPDVEWVDHIDYIVDPARSVLFENAIRQYWPNLPSEALFPDYAGIRPKIARGSPHDTDFVIQGPEEHGIEGLVNLYGIESPGLTSSLALADEVLSRLTA